MEIEDKKEILVGKIVNKNQLEIMIKTARFNADNLEKAIKDNDIKRAEVLSEELSLQLHELDIFKFKVEFQKQPIDIIYKNQYLLKF